jgi:GNAT superfamily N-acetyltransferase
MTVEIAPPKTTVEVAPVRGRSALRAFVELPFRLHAGTPWIPPLRLERYAFLNRRLNPYFKHGCAEYFVARRDGRVVGRISAQIDHAFNEFHGTRWGMFGFLEFEDDEAVLRSMLDTAAAWLAERGCERMVGPMDLSMNEECGVLVEGFELEPMIKQPWHPSYYGDRCEAVGLTKAMDLLHWELHLSDRDERMLPLLPKLARRAREKQGITIRRMSRRRLRRELDEFAKVYNSAWSHNWGFVPYAKEDLDELALTLQIVYDRNWFMIAEQDGNTVGMAITIPDINQVLKKMRGRLLPLGWWYLVTKRRHIDRMRIGFLGVLPEYEHTGAGAALYMEHFDTAARTGLTHGEAGWILETNHSMNRGLEAMGARSVKRCRVYERMLETPAER